MSLQIAADYPSKVWLNHSEAMGVLRRGPEPEWFRPWAEQQGYAAPSAPFRFGLVHVHGSPVRGDMRTFWFEEDMRWAMETAYRWHLSHACPGCQGLFYLTPVKPEARR